MLKKKISALAIAALFASSQVMAQSAAPADKPAAGAAGAGGATTAAVGGVTAGMVAAAVAVVAVAAAASSGGGGATSTDNRATSLSGVLSGTTLTESEVSKVLENAGLAKADIDKAAALVSTNTAVASALSTLSLAQNSATSTAADLRTALDNLKTVAGITISGVVGVGGKNICAAATTCTAREIADLNGVAAVATAKAAAAAIEFTNALTAYRDAIVTAVNSLPVSEARTTALNNLDSARTALLAASTAANAAKTAAATTNTNYQLALAALGTTGTTVPTVTTTATTGSTGSI